MTSAGTRKVPFSRELFIERDDFMERSAEEVLPALAGQGSPAALRAISSPAPEVVKDDRGEIVELRCTYDPATRGGDSPDGRRVKATLHWVSAAHAVPVEVRLYDRLFSVEDPENVPEGKTFLDQPESRIRSRSCAMRWSEPSLASSAARSTALQFERLGYFCDRSRFTAWRARLQPHRLAPRRVGEDRAEEFPSPGGVLGSAVCFAHLRLPSL